MLTSEIMEWSQRCAEECDAERDRILRIHEEGGELPLERLCILSQVSFACYGLEALANGLEQLESYNAGGN